MAATQPSIQSAIDLFAKSLAAPRILFDLYPNPRPQAAPRKAHRAIPPAVVQGVTAAFEAFAEELVVVSLLRLGETWAQIAKHANLTNPTLTDLCHTLRHASGIAIADPAPNTAPWTLALWHKTSTTAWYPSRKLGWSDLLHESEGWMQVRHCLTHGLVTGTEPAHWPGPVTGRAHGNRSTIATASDVLAAATKGRKSLTMYPAINCGLVYSNGGAQIAKQVAAALGDSVDVSGLRLFEGL